MNRKYIAAGKGWIKGRNLCERGIWKTRCFSCICGHSCGSRAHWFCVRMGSSLPGDGEADERQGNADEMFLQRSGPSPDRRTACRERRYDAVHQKADERRSGRSCGRAVHHSSHVQRRPGDRHMRQR